MDIKRVIMIVLDSAGVGEAFDANEFGDVSSNTWGHITEFRNDINVPNMTRLGIFNIDTLNYLNKKSDDLMGSYGYAKELSRGKETLVGHWEIAGVVSDKPLPTYPNGFPKEIIDEFERRTGRKTIGNKPASGTAILDELGEEHMKTGCPIVYTSADSVFQIAAHKDIIPLEELYSMCKIAREILVGNHAVSRVIARPFIGTPGNFTRTSERHDFALSPSKKTILDKIKDKGYDVCAVGKIRDIFNGEGITDYVFTKDNMDGVDKTLEYMKQNKNGIIFTNLVEFDMLWGHRRDTAGYANGLEAFDARLPEIISSMNDDDLLLITADHGCDPTFKGTDHTREFIPVLLYGKHIKSGVNIGLRNSFADIASTIAEIFDCEKFEAGESFLDLIKK